MNQLFERDTAEDSADLANPPPPKKVITLGSWILGSLISLLAFWICAVAWLVHHLLSVPN